MCLWMIYWIGLRLCGIGLNYIKLEMLDYESNAAYVDLLQLDKIGYRFP